MVEKKEAKKKGGKKTGNKAPKRKSKKKKFYEIFKIKKKGEKEKTVKKEGEVAEKPASEEQLESQNKIFRNFVIVILGIIIGFIAVMWFFSLSNKFEYRGVDFERVQMGELTFYRTSFPVTSSSGEKTDYKIYLRNHPEKLDERVPFEGKLSLTPRLALDFEKDFVCEGKGAVAIGNFQRMEAFGMKIVENENATCDSSSRYTLLKFREDNKTSVEQTGASCYNINVNSCEIIDATERFMLETFVKVNKVL